MKLGHRAAGKEIWHPVYHTGLSHRGRANCKGAGHKAARSVKPGEGVHADWGPINVLRQESAKPAVRFRNPDQPLRDILASMNWLQSLRSRCASWLNPATTPILKSAERLIDRLDNQNQLYRAMINGRRDQIQAEILDYQEAIALNGGGWLARESASGKLDTAIRESDSTAVVKCKETIADLQLALEDRGWRRELDQAQWEFSRWGIQRIILLCRLYRIKNPLIQRGILVSAYYVFGRGFEVSSEDETANKALQDFFYDPRNAGEIGQRALVDKESAKYTDGNIFWCFFEAEDGRQLIRTIDPLEIEEIVCDPNDSSQPRYYHRRWTEQVFIEDSGITAMRPRDEWYVAMEYDAPAGQQINGKPLFSTPNGERVPIFHTKSGSLLKAKFGCPRAYAALDWARAYRVHLENFATCSAALARFSWDVETEGGAPAIAALKATLATQLGITDGMGYDQNQPPVTGSTFVRDLGTKIAPFKTSNMLPDAEGGRRMGLMVCSVFGLPETFIMGDVSVGTLATGQSLDRPSELKFKKEQEDWREDLQRIAYYVLDRSRTAPKGRMREASKGASEDITVEVKFPPIIQDDIPAMVTATVEAMFCNGAGQGIDLKIGIGLLLTYMGVENVQDVLDEMFPDYNMDRTEELAAAKDAKINPPEPVPANQPGAKRIGVSPSEARAVAALTAAAKALREQSARS